VASILFVLATDTVLSATPKIVYKISQDYDLIWKDSGSGGKKDGAFWATENYEPGYCVLGDVVTGSHSRPTTRAIAVKAIQSDALVNPSSFTRVWTDRGSGANWDVAVYRMNARSGYTCLGGVAMRSHSTQPDPSKYCCVKTEYTTPGGTRLAWDDKGTGSNYDFSAWETLQGNDALGASSGNFLPMSNYNKPQSAYVLRVDEETVKDVWLWPQDYDDKPLKIYEETSVKKIWNDAGSGAKRDVSIWRVETRPGFFSLGDIAVSSHTRPSLAFLFQLTDPDDTSSLRSPTGYSRVWSDRGSGAKQDVSIWIPYCPGGYRALGHVTTNGAAPTSSLIKCLKAEYVESASSSAWRYIWNDAGSGANSDAAFYEATARTSNQLGIRAYSAIASHHYYPGTPYLLKSTAFNYFSEKPVEKYQIINIEYHLPDEKKIQNPATMAPTIIENNSGIAQTVTREITFTTSTSSTFEFSRSIEIGVSMEVTGGIPLIGSVTTTVDGRLSDTFTVGETTTTEKSDSISASITAPPYTTITASINCQEYKADIPFTAKVKKTYYDGTTGETTTTGVYKGVAVSECTIRYSDPEPIR